MELTGEHLLTLDELITLLSISDDFTIAFVRCNELVLRNALSTTIENRMHDDIYIYNIKMGEDATNLLQLLNDAVTSELYISLKEDNKKIAFFIYGLDEAVEKKNQQGRSEALLLLNMMREDFQKIQHPLIIWINKASLILILKEAQDFFSWRTTVFEFDMEHEMETSPLTDFGDTDLVFLTREELEDRWDYYCGLLTEYKEKGIGDAYKAGHWNHRLGMIKLLMGYAEESVKYFKESLVKSREIEDRLGEGTHLGNLGSAYSDLGQVEKAIEYYEQALVISKETGDRRGEGTRLGNLGSAYSHLGQVEKAIEYYEQALVILKETGDKRGEGTDLGNLGLAYSDLGDTNKAIKYLNRALTIGNKIQDPKIINYCKKHLNSLTHSED
ncbi:MAG: tetratricopeptide repeat protein [Euryarchaeota archaeon]|nr:tetratricopeptide repeat protein [Euryarchaeota archaeon]